MTNLWRQLMRLLVGERRRVPRTVEARSIIRRQNRLAAEVRRRDLRHSALRAQQRLGR